MESDSDISHWLKIKETSTLKMKSILLRKFNGAEWSSPLSRQIKQQPSPNALAHLGADISKTFCFIPYYERASSFRI